MTDSLRDTLPAAHRHLLPEVYDRPAVVETRATCGDCAMCPKGDRTPGAADVFFRPDLKCCTYHPTLPNFLVGAILADDSPEMSEGKRRVEERIARRIGVTPQWLAPPRKQRVLLEAARGTSFGRSKALLCPYFDGEGGGLCTVWRHRESVCSTFFCKHDAGAVGDAFWMANKQFLGTVELALSRHAAQAVSPDVTEPRIPRLKLTIEDLEDRPPNEDDYAGYWGEWVGREADFYRACHAHVQAMTAADLTRLLDEPDEPHGPERLAELVRRHDALASSAIAARLVPNPKMRTTTLPGGVGVTTYSLFDAMCLTPDLFEVVRQFRADETVAETRARLAREHDVEIPDALLLSLQQHEILVPPDAG
ncbi:MAG: hypothetical protein KF764_29850 [Labilithrix sp.]|nr:hypothetical protein [Labilithrix sp.]